MGVLDSIAHWACTYPSCVRLRWIRGRKSKLRQWRDQVGMPIWWTFFAARGINKSMKIATKYNTKQAAYYKDRLSQDLDGKVSSLPDPGSYEQVAVDKKTVAGNTN